jgi:hypothetical protein
LNHLASEIPVEIPLESFNAGVVKAAVATSFVLGEYPIQVWHKKVLSHLCPLQDFKLGDHLVSDADYERHGDGISDLFVDLGI